MTIKTMSKGALFATMVDYLPENVRKVKRMKKLSASQYFTQEAHDFLRENRETVEMFVHGMLASPALYEISPVSYSGGAIHDLS